MSINGWCNNMRFRSEHTRECLTFVCEDAPVLTGNAGLQYVAKVKEVLSNIQSRRDVVLDLADVVVVSLNVVEQLICLKAALADENRNLVLMSREPGEHNEPCLEILHSCKAQKGPAHFAGIGIPLHGSCFPASGRRNRQIV